MLINTSYHSANIARRFLDEANQMTSVSLNRLSSGIKTVNSGEDAGGFAVGTKLHSRINRKLAVGGNIQNALSFMDAQQSCIKSVGDTITRMSELKTMSLDISKNSSDLENYNKEFVELQKQIESITKHKFNGVSLFSDTSKFVNTHENGDSEKGVDLVRDFLSGKFIAESGVELGQRTTQGSGGSLGTGGSSSNYTLDQWRADYDEWINYDDSNWDNDFLKWMADPVPYGGAAVLNQIKAARVNSDLVVDLSSSNITNIEPLIGLVDVEQLLIRDNNIEDISVLSGLANIVDLKLQGNNVSDISPIAGWVNPREIWLDDNNIDNLVPIENLSNLTGGLGLSDNNISDLTPLKNFSNIANTTGLYLTGNPIAQSQKYFLEAAIPSTNIFWPNPILPDTVEPEAPTTTTGYPSLDQFTTKDFTNFTQTIANASAQIGSQQSRLNMEMRHNESTRINLESAKGGIMDTDVAIESTRLAKANLLTKSSASMIAQANKLSDIDLRMIIND